MDIQHAQQPDLRGYQKGKHKAILLDEMASPSFIVSNKKLLQAHVGGAIFRSVGNADVHLFRFRVADANHADHEQLVSGGIERGRPELD